MENYNDKIVKTIDAFGIFLATLEAARRARHNKLDKKINTILVGIFYICIMLTILIILEIS